MFNINLKLDGLAEEISAQILANPTLVAKAIKKGLPKALDDFDFEGAIQREVFGALSREINGFFARGDGSRTIRRAVSGVLEQVMPSDEPTREELDSRIKEAVEVADDFGGTDGEHHKMWVIDQMVRFLLRTPEAYDAFVKNRGEYGWDEGITP